MIIPFIEKETYFCDGCLFFGEAQHLNHPSHFINSLIQLTFIKYLPCARHCPTNCGFSYEHRRPKSLLPDSSASCLFSKQYILFLLHFTRMHSVVLFAIRNPDLYISAGEEEPSNNMHWSFRAISILTPPNQQ